jgi:hypothetical protein
MTTWRGSGIRLILEIVRENFGKLHTAGVLDAGWRHKEWDQIMIVEKKHVLRPSQRSIKSVYELMMLDQRHLRYIYENNRLQGLYYYKQK